MLPRLIGMLVARRREAKALLKRESDASRRTQVPPHDVELGSAFTL